MLPSMTRLAAYAAAHVLLSCALSLVAIVSEPMGGAGAGGGDGVAPAGGGGDGDGDGGDGGGDAATITVATVGGPTASTVTPRSLVS